MKYNLIMALVFVTGLAWASTPNFDDTLTEIEEEAEERQQKAIDQVPLPSVIYSNDLTPADIEEGLETGVFSTNLSRTEGGEPTLQQLFRADMIQNHYVPLNLIIDEYQQDIAKQVDLALRHVDGDESNGGLDALAAAEKADVEQHGPLAKASDPAWAKDSSNTLNPAPDPSSQIGDLCMSASGNSSQLSVASVTETYPNACDGDSEAEEFDCLMGGAKVMNSEAKGGSATSTQIMQGPETPQNIAETETAKTRNFNVPSCPTQPRMAESVPPNIENLVAGDRAQIEQADLVINASNTVTAAIPKTKFMVQQTLPWYQRLLSFAFPSTVMANITPAAGFTETLQGRANTTGRANELQQQNFEKLISDLRSHPDMAAEQQFANTMSRMLEEKNKALRSQLEFATAHNENEQDIAYDSVMSQY